MPRIDRQAIYARDGGLCAFCGEPVQIDLMHLDHKQPRGLGGLTIPENMRVAHRRCNIVAGQAVATERRRLGLPSTTPEGSVQVRDVPADLWLRVRKAAAGLSTAEQRVSIRDVVLEALAEWLGKRGY